MADDDEKEAKVSTSLPDDLEDPEGIEFAKDDGEDKEATED
jgi:hypothetical protein